jgi:dUTP pyrophosphatase
MTPVVNILRLPEADAGVALPSYESSGAAGADVRANFADVNRAAGVTLYSGERRLIPTGFKMEIPVGYEAQIRPRSGLALKAGVTLTNAPGTIDSDYRGPVGVILHNLGSEPFAVKHGDRIAQIVIAPVTQAMFAETAELGTTSRGDGGFGSTGRS